MSTSTLHRLAASWWGATLHPSRWFAHRFGRDAEGSERPGQGALWFACAVAAPAFALGMGADSLVTGGTFLEAAQRASVALFLSPAVAVGGALATALVTHAALRLMGARGPWSRTLDCVGYAAGAELFAAVPWFGPVIAGTWRLLVLARALQIAHHIPAYRSAIAVLAGPLWFVVIAVALRVSFVDSYKIPAGSMVPTLLPGDHVLVRRGPYDPDRGDVMVFRYPENPSSFYVKRIIGMPGDEIRVVGGRPVINGWTVPRCLVGAFEPGYVPGDWPARGVLYVEFLRKHAYLVFIDRVLAYQQGSACSVDRDCRGGRPCQDGLCAGVQGPYRVAPGELWVLGDNRLNSHDSRTWFGGRGGGVPYDRVVGPAWMVWAHVDGTASVRFDRTGVSFEDTPRLTGPMAPSLSSRLAWCLEHRPTEQEATPP